MPQDGKNLEEDIKRQQLKERRKRLQELRKQKIEEAEAAKAAGDYLRAKDLFMEAAEISKELAEKERMRTFRATAEEMLRLERERRERSQLSKKIKEGEIQRRKLLAEAENLMKEGKFKDAAAVYKKAAEVSYEMKEEERAKELEARAKEIIEKEFEYMKKWEKEKDIRLKEAELARVLSRAEALLEQVGKEEEAADLYIQAANITKSLGRKELAEKYVERAREIREIKKQIERRIEEEKKKRELELERQINEDRRAQAIANAEKAMEQGKFELAAKHYEIASEASAALGEKAIAQEFKATAKKIRETKDELKREYEERKKKKPLRQRRRILLAKAKQQLERERFVEAAKLFKLAAVISGEMGEDAKVKDLVAKVRETMKMEKRRKEEIIERVMKAFKAIVTLRTLEPDIAVSLYEWTSDGPKYVVVHVWDVGSITLKFEKGKPKITSGERKKDVAVRVEGTAASIMGVAQGKISLSWAKLTGRIVIEGKIRDINYFTQLMIIPMLEREKDELDKRSVALGTLAVVLMFFFVTYFPTGKGPLIDVNSWGETLKQWFIQPIPGAFGEILYNFISNWAIANFWIFPIIYIVIASALNYITIKRYRISQAKEKLRIKRRRAMDRAERASKRGALPEAIRLYEQAVKYALHAGEDEIAQELVQKINEIIKLIPTPTKKKKKGKKGKGKGKGGKGKKMRGISMQEQKEREQLKKEAEQFQRQMETYVKEAERALEEGDFKAAAEAYGKAATVAKNVGDKDKVLQFSEQAEVLLKMYKDMEKQGHKK